MGYEPGYRFCRRRDFCKCRSSLETARYRSPNPPKTIVTANNISAYNDLNSNPGEELLQCN